METEIYSYDDSIRKIDRIEFTVWSSDEILRYSALEKDTDGIMTAELYDNQEPKRGGLNCLRLGTTTESKPCDTCGLSYIYCPGHFGHSTFSTNVFHVGYLQTVKKILSCVCIKCSKLLIYKNENEMTEMLKNNKSSRSKLSEVRNLVKNIQFCQKANYGCGSPIPKIKLDIKKTTGITLYAETSLTNLPKEEMGQDGKKKNRKVLTPSEVYDILKNISDQDCMILGLNPKVNRPEELVYKVFPIPPIAVRPSVRAEFMGSSLMEDDLTHKLADIIKANERISHHNESENGAKYTHEHHLLLQYHTASYMGDETNLPKTEQKGKVFKSLSPRLKSKEGRIRGNLMGKRVNFSARTVITSDPTIEINQLGVPMKIAMNLTFPEVVTPNNIKFLSKLVKNGRVNYPGANFVFQDPIGALQKGKRVLPIDLRFRRDNIELRYGDIVERHLMDNDIVLLNRQPTLHKQSMMGHRVKVINNPNLLTFRLSPTVTTPYNADFDGDEMNIFLCQSIQTQIELEEIADVKRQIITPATSRTIIGIVQDGLIGAYNITSPNMQIDWKNAMNIISYTSMEEFSSFKKTDYTGHEIFSMIVPPKINVKRGEGEKQIIIKNGQVEKGYITNELLGSKKKNNLTQLIWDEYGVEETKKFLNNTLKLVNNFNLYNGFTVGVGDATISEDVTKQIHRLFETKDLKIANMVTEYENNPDMMDRELFERSIFSELNVIREDVSKLIINNAPIDNKFKTMMLSGSKGGPQNLGQMSGCVGLQAFEGNLIPKKLNNRTTPYFFHNEDSSESRGLIKKPFIKGMSFPEFFFHNMTGREGLIDQAIKSVTGDTLIMINQDENILNVEIGKWINELMNNNKNKIIYQEEQNMESLNIEEIMNVEIPTTDYNGNITWGKIKAVTRHDPGKKLYEVKTKNGKEVKVTESKSLLIWNEIEKMLEMKSTGEVRIGDKVPVTKYLNNIHIISNKVLEDYVKNTQNLEGEIVNDILLDEIIEMKELDVEKYPKVYDLTVPSTLNFGLANGLHVVDTAESGYIQRKLIKLMEDYMVEYDCTVRSAQKQIIQFIYGDTGADTTKQYEYNMSMLEMGDKELMERHKFTKEEMKNYKFNEKENDELYRKIIKMRDDLRIVMIRTRMNWIVMNTIFMLPINFQRIIETYKNDSELKKKGGELTPEYILERYEYILNNKNTMLMTMKQSNRDNVNSVKYQDDRIVKTSLLAAMYDCMSPKRCIVEYGMNKSQFDGVVMDIVNSFNKNMVEPGETVGTIAAQSLGEPTTQLSCSRLSYVLIGHQNNIYYGQIGTFIDELMKNNNNLVKNVPNHPDSTVLDLPNSEYKIIGVSDNGKTSWNSIIQISKHPANGNLIKVTTKSGRTTTATLSHSFLKNHKNKIIPVKGSDLKKGDRIPVAKSIKFIVNPKYSTFIDNVELILDKDFGEFCGLYLADGSLNGNRITITKVHDYIQNLVTKIGEKYCCTISTRKKQGRIHNQGKVYDAIDTIFTHKQIAQFLDENFCKGSWNKCISGFIHSTNQDFIAGIIKGYIECDGNVNAPKCLIRVSSRSEQLIKDIAVLLKYFGIFTSICKEFKKEQYERIGDGTYHTLHIHRKYAEIFRDQIGIGIDYKSEDLNKIIEYNNRENKISDKEEIDIVPEVGEILLKVARKLKLESRDFNKYNDGIGRKTLGNKIQQLEEALNKQYGLTNGDDKEKAKCEMEQEIENKIISIERKISETLKVYIRVLSLIKTMIEKNKQQYDDNENHDLSDEKRIMSKPKMKITYDMDINKYFEQLEKLNNVENVFNKCIIENHNYKILSGNDVRKTKDFSKNIIELMEYVLNARHTVEDLITELDPDYLKQVINFSPTRKKISKVDQETYNEIMNDIKILKDAYESDVIWDEIVELEILEDPKEYVYDFTVPGNDSFMVDTGIIVHNTLNSFHHAGISVMATTTQGVPRVKELLSLSKNIKTPQMVIYPTNEYMGSRSMAHKIASYIEYTTIGHLRDKITVVYDPDPYRKGGYIETDKATKVFTSQNTSKNSCQGDITGLHWLLRVELDREKLLEKEVTLIDIKSKICQAWERRNSDKSIKKEDKQIYDNVTQISIMSNSDYDNIPVIHIRFDMMKFDMTILNSFIDLIIDNFKLKGIPSINGIGAISEERALVFDGPNHDIEKKKQYVIYTMGTNLHDIRYLTNIDINKTITNDVVAMYQAFGIEAARATLLREVIYAYERAGSSVGYQHVAVLIDLMTFNGTLTSIDRFGMNKTDTGPLSRSSFEKPVDILFNAAVGNETDNMNGVSSRIMAGLVPRIGTGLVNVILDKDMIQNSEFTEDLGQKYVKTYNDINKNDVIEDITNNDIEESDMFIPE